MFFFYDLIVFEAHQALKKRAMKSISILTGGGTGIGRALTLRLANRGFDTLAIGRRKEPLEEIRNENPEHIQILAADIGTEEGRSRILEALPDHVSVKFLVHNAAVMEPLGPLEGSTLDQWRIHQSINVEGPLFLTVTLLPFLKGGRILHISSGAAHKASAGQGAYCASKAALYMIYRVFQEELKETNICIGSVCPGAVDTPMQELLRSAPQEMLPDLPRFIQHKERDQLTPPEVIARFLEWLLIKTSDEEFSAKEWRFQDTNHYQNWMKARSKTSALET